MKRTLSALDGEEYEMLLKWLKDEYDIPIKDRTVKDRNALRKFYRWRVQGLDLQIGNDGRYVYVDGKRLLRKSDVESEIRRIDKETKCSGSRKAKSRLNSSVIGISEAHIVKSRLKRINLEVPSMLKKVYANFYHAA